MDLSCGVKERAEKHTESPKNSPWKRRREEFVVPSFKNFMVTMNSIDEKFDYWIYPNLDLDITTKRVALRVSASVVGLISQPRAGGDDLFHASGTIYETSENGDGGYLCHIVTSASLIGSSDKDDIKIMVYTAGDRIFDGKIVGYDPHYNLAIISIISDESLPAAKLRLIDESLSVDPEELSRSSRELKPHSRKFKICPGEMVVALGRSCVDNCFELMAAPGKYSLDNCGYDCIELLMATCKITKPGIGGPLVNHYGEMIGVNFMNEDYTSFLPMNIVEKCLNHFNQYGKFCRPWIGVSSWTNLYAADVYLLERMHLKNPHVSRGVFIEAVIKKNSPARRAGLKKNDFIVQCNGKLVNGLLEFSRKMLNKAGKSVEVDVIRKGHDGLLKLNIDVEDFPPDRINGWPLPEEQTIKISRYR